MISVLHLSDLHRSSDDPISNDELLVALATDKVRYTNAREPIRAPDAIVVSGDIIQGVGLGFKDARTELNAQYAVAEKFLASLADEFLAGDRSQLVIAPGNHDVDWNLAREAMTPIPASESIHYGEALKIGSRIRWSWKDKSFYRIHDELLYQQRFDAYWDFVERFYADARGIPKLNRAEPYSLFSLAQGRVGVSVFNSCHWNDCYAFHGAIDRSAIAAAQRQMLQNSSFQLWMAVWHHSIDGVPYRNDYMDIDQVRDMVGYGYRLGLHGHQHKHQITPAQVHLPDRETMAVVSAGSLCAGPKELPTGFFRQYNIVELRDDLLSARVHVRQMETGHLFSPSHMTVAGGRSFVDVEWSQPLSFPVPPSSRTANVLEAEQLFQRGNAAQAAQMLGTSMPDATGYARALFVQASVRAGLWEEISTKLAIPHSIDELVALVEALDQLRRPSDGLHALSTFAATLGMPEKQQRELSKRLTIRGGLPK